MTIVYLCGENSIWKISNVELLESALTEEDLDLVRIIQEDANIRGKFRVEYELMDLGFPLLLIFHLSPRRFCAH